MKKILNSLCAISVIFGLFGTCSAYARTGTEYLLDQCAAADFVISEQRRTGSINSALEVLGNYSEWVSCESMVSSIYLTLYKLNNERPSSKQLCLPDHYPKGTYNSQKAIKEVLAYLKQHPELVSPKGNSFQVVFDMYEKNYKCK